MPKVLTTEEGTALITTETGGAQISVLIGEIRTELNDDAGKRFSDAQLLNLFKKAIRRCNRIVQRAGLQFAKKKSAITTVANQAYVDLDANVTDFDVWIGLYRDDTHTQIPTRTEHEWETIYSAAALTSCYFDQWNGKIYFSGTPTSAVALTLWYYPVVDPSSYTIYSATPWAGRLDDIIMEYVALRAKNIDEMDASFDLKLMTDMENQILQSYAPNTSNIAEGKGWL